MPHCPDSILVASIKGCTIVSVLPIAGGEGGMGPRGPKGATGPSGGDLTGVITSTGSATSVNLALPNGIVTKQDPQTLTSKSFGDTITVSAVAPHMNYYPVANSNPTSIQFFNGTIATPGNAWSVGQTGGDFFTAYNGSNAMTISQSGLITTFPSSVNVLQNLTCNFLRGSGNAPTAIFNGAYVTAIIDIRGRSLAGFISFRTVSSLPTPGNATILSVTLTPAIAMSGNQIIQITNASDVGISSLVYVTATASGFNLTTTASSTLTTNTTYGFYYSVTDYV